MKRFIPTRVEIAIFVTMAVICTAAMARMNASSHDLGLSLLACPIFVIAAVLGLRRSPVWTAEQSESDANDLGKTPDEADLA